MIRIEKNKIRFHYDAEELWIEPWGNNALRIRATKEAEMPLRNWALMEPETSCCEIKETPEGAEIANGKIRATITKLGKLWSMTIKELFYLKNIGETEEICWMKNAVLLKLKQESFAQM